MFYSGPCPAARPRRVNSNEGSRTVPDEEHPALVTARQSWRCVQAKDREGWLSLMADDVCIEDPIGVAPTNPSGQGVRGLKAVGDFWDQFIAPSTVRVETHESFVAGSESAHLLTLRTTLPNGYEASVRGVFTYRLNEAGKLEALRGYWTISDVVLK
jgi:steroid delta-isomerase